MPSIVTACDFCSETSTDFDKIVRHEKECEWNPNNHKCWTCKFWVDEGMPISGPMYMCTCKENPECGHYIEDQKPCDFWEAE